MDWGVVSTINVNGGYPMGLPLSVSDGPVENSTGVPYLYIAMYDTIKKNMATNPKASVTFAEAQTEYCSRNNYEPEYTLCARLMLKGKLG